MLEPARADGEEHSQPAPEEAATSDLTPAPVPGQARLFVLPRPRSLALASPGVILRIVLPVLLLAAVGAATLAALPLLTAALHADTLTVATPAEAVTLGLTSGRAVTLAVNVDDARRVRSPRRGAPVWYAPASGDGTLLIRTDDVERLRLRPLTVTGRVTTLGALGEGTRTIAALRDARGAPVTAQTPVLVEQNLIGTALLTGLTLLVAWTTAAGAIWFLRWETAPAPRREQAQPVPHPAFRDEPLPGA